MVAASASEAPAGAITVSFCSRKGFYVKRRTVRAGARVYTLWQPDEQIPRFHEGPIQGIVWRGGQVSPILVRPVREQLEHDRVIRLLQVKLKRKHDVVDEYRRGPDGSGAHRPGADFSRPGADVRRSRQEADGDGRGRNRRIGQSPRGDGAVGPPRPGPGAVPSLRSGRLASTSPGAWRPKTTSTSRRSGATTPSATRPGSRWCTGRRPPSRAGPRRPASPPTRSRPSSRPAAAKSRAAAAPTRKAPGKATAKAAGPSAARSRSRCPRRKKGSKPCPRFGSAATSAATRPRYVVHTPRRRNKGRSRILYWFRTPPGVRVGRAAIDEDAIRLIEAASSRHPVRLAADPQRRGGAGAAGPAASGKRRGPAATGADGAPRSPPPQPI